MGALARPGWLSVCRMGTPARLRAGGRARVPNLRANLRFLGSSAVASVGHCVP